MRGVQRTQLGGLCTQHATQALVNRLQLLACHHKSSDFVIGLLGTCSSLAACAPSGRQGLQCNGAHHGHGREDCTPFIRGKDHKAFSAGLL